MGDPPMFTTPPACTQCKSNLTLTQGRLSRQPVCGEALVFNRPTGNGFPYILFLPDAKKSSRREKSRRLF